MAASDLYFAVNDMDAQVANVLLVGGEQDLGFTRAQALVIYEQRRQQADTDLQRVAVTATDPAAQRSVRDVLDRLGRYEALVGQTILLDGQADGPGATASGGHRAGLPPTAALDTYRQATDLLKSILLPAVSDLGDRSSAELEATYQARRSGTVDGRLWLGALGGALLVMLLALQVYLARRLRRLVNPWLAVATLLAGVLVVGGAVLLSDEAGHLRVAKRDAFDSILALTRARALSYDANADESRYLVDPSRGAQYQQSFVDKSQQLVGLPGATVGSYDSALSAALQNYGRSQDDVGWQGLFGTEFRNITFTGERAAAEATLTRYQTYQLDDRRIRQLVDAGRLRDAIALCTSYAPGGSNGAAEYR